MRVIFADSFYWITLANPADQWHRAVREFNQANQDMLLVTTDEVLTEFLNYFAEAHVDKLTQAILARAFRGEIVTTETELARLEGRDYEPASVLLERIRQERGADDTRRPSRRQKRASSPSLPY